ncbi:glycosyl transferase family 90 [Vibrio coralliirubri]|uniref:glycosyl transferase family 90 n=1 Tax=Vibrio coralliirubri TaxID=1516159 RepID=UPI000A3D0F66|nr:glycosyl transferase family 90 [Vibrio coralliirubri]
MRKLKYYLSNSLLTILPAAFFRQYAKKTLDSAFKYDKNYIKQRVDYYCKLESNFELSDANSTLVQNFTKTGGTTYYYDLLKVVKAFPSKYAFNYVNGDVTTVPNEPSFLKSRPIEGDNDNSIILKLNAIRHYVFIEKDKPYKSKKNMVVWRGAGFRSNRLKLLKMFVDHPKFDIGETRPLKADPKLSKYKKAPLSLAEQLEYKFIISLEGRDVATNLKWIMSSNSLCFTPKLRYETWFMEGKLKAGIHFVEVKDDFSDLVQKMNYYLEHPDEAEAIIQNANQWVEQFKDTKQERLISLLVAQKYFEKSGQQV